MLNVQVSLKSLSDCSVRNCQNWRLKKSM